MAASGFWRARLFVHLGAAKKKAAPSSLAPEIRFHLLRNFSTGRDPETELLPFSVAAYLKTSFGFSLERAKAWSKPSVLKERVDEIAEMGFGPSTTIFSYAVVARAGLKKETWESKFEIYRKWGWSRKDTLRAFAYQ